MKLLCLHSDFLEFEPVSKALKSAEAVDKAKKRVEECLVCFSCVEKDDESDLDGRAAGAVAEIENILNQIKVRKVVIYPFVHLSPNPAAPEKALDGLQKMENILEKKGYDVSRAPFGWYKKFVISCKGHPLAEWSREIKAIAAKKAEKSVELSEIKGEKFKKFVVIDVEGTSHEITREDWEKCKIWNEKEPVYKMLKIFVRNELAKKTAKSSPKHIEYMRKLELVDYCPESDIGNMKWYPDGVLIFDLIQDYAFNKIALPWGAFKMKNPLIYRKEVEEIGKLMGEFHERDYWAIGGDDKFVIRFASDPGGFPFVQKLGFSYKQMPLKVYEEAQCFRHEQAGEVVGLARVRNFNMTDMHAFCKDEPQAREEFEKLCKRFAQLMNEVIGKDKWVLGWEGTEDFYEKNKGWLIKIGKDLNVPAFFKLMREMSHYYVIKNEYQVVSPDENNIQVSTVQWDIKDGERFHICFVDANGKKVPVPVIIHASSFGSIERTLWSILETAARDETEGKAPCLPFWLSPSQVRLCPVSDDHVKFCEEIADKIQKENIRVDIDDRTETISNKVRKAEMDWVPYVLVVGDKEKTSGKFQVRVRKDKSQKSLTFEQLMEEVGSHMVGMPFRPRYLPREISKRPIFVG